MNVGVSVRKHAGFTLVELLLAVTLMSILLGLAYGGLRAAARATERGQAVLEASGTVRSAHQFMRRQLNQMQPLPFEVAQDTEQTRVVFQGDSRRIQYVGPMPGYLGQGGPQVQVLELVPGENGLDLVFTHALLQDFAPEHLMARDPIVLLEDIDRGGFEFLALDDAGELSGWTNSWTLLDKLPTAVSLDLAFNEEQQVLWPMMATGVKVDETAIRAGGGTSGYEDAIRDLIDRGSDDR